MALKGYTVAFDKTLELLPAQTERVQLSEEVIHDLYAALWWPSVDAGIVNTTDLRTWRDRRALIRGSLDVPPGHEKVPAPHDVVLPARERVGCRADRPRGHGTLGFRDDPPIPGR